MTRSSRTASAVGVAAAVLTGGALLIGSHAGGDPGVRAASKAMRRPTSSPARPPAATTARHLSAHGGPLSGPRAGDPRRVAERWLAQNARALGTSVQLRRGALKLVSHRRGADGRTTVRWTQRLRGAGGARGDLRIVVSPRGEILDVATTLPAVRPASLDGGSASVAG